MKKIILSILLAVFPVTCFAATLTLRSGKIIEGNILEDTPSSIKIETTGGRVLFFEKKIIVSIKREGDKGQEVVLAQPLFKTGLLDYSSQGYLLYVPHDIGSVSDVPVLICFPGYGVKAKQEINNWAFLAAKEGFFVIALDVDYKKLGSLSALSSVYSKISDILDSLRSRYPISAGRLYIAGTSAGGMLSMALILRYSDKFEAAGVVSGGRLGYGAQSQLKNAHGCHFYMVHGGQDASISLREFQDTRKKLEAEGAIIKYKVYSYGQHILNSNAYGEVVEWLAGQAK